MTAYIVDFARSPFTRAHKGALAGVRPDEMLGQVVKALVARSVEDPLTLEALYVGCAMPEGEQGLNVGRIAVFLAGLPLSVAGVTVNHFCGSSMQALHMAVASLAAGAGDAFLCAGVESMTRVPMMGFNPLPHPSLVHSDHQVYMSMGETAENVAHRFSISREAQEAFAVRSHQKALAAQEKGFFSHELVPITHKGGTVERDGCPRSETTAEVLSQLPPAFDKEKGVVTSGTSSPLTDGAVAVLVCGEAYLKAHNLTPMARVCSTAVSGCAPNLMGMGPVVSSQKALKRANLSVSDLDVVEINEAFAAPALACLGELGLEEEKVNLDGGAIALGHPLGATGARITAKAASLLQREKKRYALATQCIGGGQGIATVLEAV